MSTHEQAPTGQHEDQHDARPAGPGRRRGAGGRGGSGRVIRVAGDALNVRRVFGEPVVGDGVTLVPVAKVMGGSGSGYGSGELGGGTSAAQTRGEGTGSGGGGGFAVRVKPVGVYVVRGAEVRWQPALDLNRVILGGQVVGAVVAVALACVLRRRRR